MNAQNLDDDPRPYRAGVGILLLNAQSQVWVGERVRRKGQQLEFPWQAPQGGIDDGEDPSDAAWRELAEETGVTSADLIAETGDWLFYDLPLEVRDQVWKGRFRGQKQKWYLFRHTGDESEIDLNAHQKPEFSAWRWVAPAELPVLVVPFKRSIYAQVLEAFAGVLATGPEGALSK